MIKQVHPVQNFKNLSTGKKVATVAAGAAVAAGAVLSVKRGTKFLLENQDVKAILKGKNAGIFQKFVFGALNYVGYGAALAKCYAVKGAKLVFSNADKISKNALDAVKKIFSK